MTQLSIFDIIRSPPVIVPVEPYGHVLQGEPDVTHVLHHPRMAWDHARIELHRHENGLWMWATGFMTGGGGSSYRVGAKWGKFAETQADALYYACVELEQRIGPDKGKEAALILNWVAGLKQS